MIASAEWLNPTRLTGLTAYGTAVTCCIVAWAGTKNKSGSLSPFVFVFIESLLLLDIVFDWRWKLHDGFSAIAVRHHEYASRRLPQTILVLILGVLLLVGLIATWRRFRGGVGALLAVSGITVSMILWCVEVVSLHAVDRILYTLIGGVMAVSFLWILASAMTSIGILLETRREAG